MTSRGGIGHASDMTIKESVTAAITPRTTEATTALGETSPASPVSAWRHSGVIALAAVAFAIEMAVSARYGYHRDELYFLEAGKHLALGYVDQPVLVPLLAHLDALAFGNTLVGLRLVPALCLSWLVISGAVMSQLLGAGRRGQVVAAAATASCGEYLATCHLFSTTTIDFSFWALVLLVVLRLLRDEDPRWWLPLGACVGVALDAKWNIAVLVLGLAVGMAATSARRLLWTRQILYGILLAVALGWPDVAWQAAHGWPNLQVFGALHQAAGHNFAVYWPAQVVYTGLALFPLAVIGVRAGLRDRGLRRYLPVTIAVLVVLVLEWVLGGKPYYPGAVFTYLAALGSVAVERRLATAGKAEGRRAGRLLAREIALAVVALAVELPIAVPVLPAQVLHSVPLQKVNYDLAETIGWPREVRLLAREYGTIPVAIRARTAVVTGNYGEAGAVDRYGSAMGLPTAYSGDNNFWLWGPPPETDTAVLAINVDPVLLHREFRRVRQVAVFTNGLGVSDDEQGVLVDLATGRRQSWSRLWPLWRAYN